MAQKGIICKKIFTFVLSIYRFYYGYLKKICIELKIWIRDMFEENSLFLQSHSQASRTRFMHPAYTAYTTEAILLQ